MVLILILMAVRIEPMAGVAQDPLGILTTNLFHGFILIAQNKYYTEWSTMDISFTNNAYAGFYELKKDSYSEMKNPYSVDTNQTFIVTNTYGTVGTKENILGSGSCLVFRTRTKVDEDGQLVSAHYGMIYGRWTTEFGMKAEAIFFNPRPNDTNLEDLDEFKRSRLKNWGAFNVSNE